MLNSQNPANPAHLWINTLSVERHEREFTCLGSVFKWNFLGQFCERVPRVSFVLLVFGARLILPGETESGSAGEHPDKG